MTASGGAPKVSFFRHRDEMLKLAHFHDRSPTRDIDHQYA